MHYRYIILIAVSAAITFTGCSPQPGEIPTYDEVVKQVTKPVTQEQAKDYCLEKGGKIEEWKNEDGTSTPFCVLPDGYGCDPVQFANGSCGKEGN